MELNASPVVDLHLLLPFSLTGVDPWPRRGPRGSGGRVCPVSWDLEGKKGYLGEESGERFLEKGKSFWHSCTSPRCAQQVQPKFMWPGECQGQGARLGLFFLPSKYFVCQVYCVILRREIWIRWATSYSCGIRKQCMVNAAPGTGKPITSCQLNAWHCAKWQEKHRDE